MKRTALIILMVVSAAALFAHGASEIDRDPPWNPIEITGTVSVVDAHPVLTAGRTTYLLGAPRMAWYLDEIEEGQTITIRGHLVAEPAVDVEIEVDGHIAVAQAVIDGEVYPIGWMGPGGRAFAGPGAMPARRMMPNRATDAPGRGTVGPRGRW